LKLPLKYLETYVQYDNLNGKILLESFIIFKIFEDSDVILMNV